MSALRWVCAQLHRQQNDSTSRKEFENLTLKAPTE